MRLDDLAKKYVPYEVIDKSDFQRRARISQSIWRERRGFECGIHQTKGVTRQLGSRIKMPWAQETLANFVTDQIRDVVRSEVLDKEQCKGKLNAITKWRLK